MHFSLFEFFSFSDLPFLMRMSSSVLNSRKYVGTVSVEPLLSITQRVEYKPPADKSLNRQTTVYTQSSLPLENAQINLKRRSHQRSLSDFIHSLFSSKKQVEHILGDINEKNINVSCPNLNNKEIVEKKFGQVHVGQFERDSMNRASSAKKLISSDTVSISQPSLQVPNIFITSLTRSRSDDNCRTRSSTVERKTSVCKSSPVLSEGASNDTNETDKKRPKRAAAINGDFCRCDFRVSSQYRLYRNENMAQITPYLFVGRAESATDQRLLCKLDIHSLIDITNSPRNDHHMNLVCPCTCTSNESHVHPKLYVNVEDTETGSIKEHFPIINKFIDGSRELGRGTLIFSVSGRSRAPTAAIQYLVTREGMAVNEAYYLLMSRWPNTEINRGFKRCLIQLENMKATQRNISSQSVHDRCNVTLRPRVKNAWTEYPI